MNAPSKGLADWSSGISRGSVVVCVLAVDEQQERDSLVSGALVTVRSACLSSRSPAEILVVGSRAVLDGVCAKLGASASASKANLLVVEPSDGVTAAMNMALAASSPADVLLARAGVRIGADQLERLRVAALTDGTVASATPLFSGADRGVGAAGDPPLWPRIATIGADCAYIRRPALDLLGDLDSSLNLRTALDAAALRLIGLGMVHVAADDIVISASGLSEGSTEPAELALAINRDNPAQETIACDERGRLCRSVGRGLATSTPLSVTIDGRSLTSSVGGTQTYVAGLAMALIADGGATVRVLIPPDIPEQRKDALRDAGDVELLTYEQALTECSVTDVVHRPQQVFTPDDLALLRLLGRRLVVTHQDLIAYHNYTYHASVEAWRSHRRTTRLAMAVADQVVFFSEHARRDALMEDLLPTGRAHVVAIGATQPLVADCSETAPDGVLEKERFLLCLGADYAHKNRPFAIRLLAALRELGWPGRLVLAGPHVSHGSSSEDERELLRQDPDLARFIVDLGQVDESVKRWLYAHTCALLYPTVHEGFGLIPFEASTWRLPCLFAAQSSLDEVAGPAATLVPWDVHASACAVLPLLDEGPARDAHLTALAKLKPPSWADVVDGLEAVYRDAVAGPPSQAAPRAWQELERERHIVELDDDIKHLKALAQEYQDAYHALDRRVRAGLPLIDEGGLLTPEQQRGLMRVAARGRVGAALLAPFGLLGRARS